MIFNNIVQKVLFSNCCKLSFTLMRNTDLFKITYSTSSQYYSLSLSLPRLLVKVPELNHTMKVKVCVDR